MTRSILVAALLSVTLSARAANEPPLPDGFVIFSDAITPQTVAHFIARHRDETVRRVIVDSEGGDVGAALSLATWMVDRDADVEVRHLCASSCANYLFAAGRRKIIDDQAVLVWHGSILQKDFRALCAPQVPRVEAAFGPPGYLEGLTALRREAGAGFCASYRTLVADQDAFFARVHVDEYLTRMGQEPTNFDAVWTVPVQIMARMGLTDVEARSDFASPADLARFNGNAWISEPVIALGFDDAGDVVRLTP